MGFAYGRLIIVFSGKKQGRLRLRLELGVGLVGVDGLVGGCFYFSRKKGKREFSVGWWVVDCGCCFLGLRRLQKASSCDL